MVEGEYGICDDHQGHGLTKQPIETVDEFGPGGFNCGFPTRLSGRQDIGALMKHALNSRGALLVGGFSRSAIVQAA